MVLPVGDCASEIGIIHENDANLLTYAASLEPLTAPG
jgi:hypothetical protein